MEETNIARMEQEYIVSRVSKNRQINRGVRRYLDLLRIIRESEAAGISPIKNESLKRLLNDIDVEMRDWWR